jgi:SPP1 family predicted phage head-tail adaptor
MAAFIDPGQLNRRITIEQRSQAPGDFGHPVDSWEPVVPTVWASVRPLGGRELIAAQAVQAALTHTIVVRYQAALAVPVQAAQWRIVYGARHFNVLSAREMGDARQHLIFDVQEGGADGH